MLVTADRAGFGRRLVDVILLVVAPVLFPSAWIVGAVLLLGRRGGGRWSLVTLALCPGGLLVPLWFYGAGTDPPTLAPQVALPMAGVLRDTNLGAVCRVWPAEPPHAPSPSRSGAFGMG
jgi:hypothetical protein